MFQAFRPASAARGRSAVTWTGERVFLARLTGRDAPRPRLDTAIQATYHDGSLPSLAAVELGGDAVARAAVSTVLPGGCYQMLLEELPQAPRNEMRSAIGWRIRDRIDTPLEDAVVELLEMPAQARATGTKSAYAIVAKRDDVQSHIARLRSAGLKLDTIDLPELCMRNLAVRLPQDADGVAFLHFTDESGLLTITRQGVLYLVRHMDIGRLQLDMTPETQVNNGLIPSICLELQRSLDYYETHYDLPSISELVLGPGTGVGGLKPAIEQQLGLAVSELDFSSMFEMAEELDGDAQKDGLFAIGAALRRDAASGWES